MGARHDKVRKSQGKGQTKGKQMQQWSCTDCIDNYGPYVMLGPKIVQHWA